MTKSYKILTLLYFSVGICSVISTLLNFVHGNITNGVIMYICSMLQFMCALLNYQHIRID